jgi:hypothetical protein
MMESSVLMKNGRFWQKSEESPWNLDFSGMLPDNAEIYSRSDHSFRKAAGRGLAKQAIPDR